MSEHRPRTLSPSEVEQFGRICDAFKRAWRARAEPRIEDFLAQVGETLRDDLLRELIAADVDLRRELGETVLQNEYLDWFPGKQEVVEHAFALAPKRSSAQGHDRRTCSANEESATLRPSIPSQDAFEGPLTGTKVRYFGDYELLEKIARGGMGVVYKARQISLNRIVALKMILSGHLTSEEHIQRFHAEAKAAADLDHPAIVPIYEIGEHEGQHYFSMGFVEGGSLADRIKDGPLPPRDAAEYAEKVANAVAFAHERGIIHRDLKPANILLDKNGQPKVTDFGLAKKVEDASGLTATGQILGTPSYMPPEQAAGKNDEVTETADVYGLGAILYTMLTGCPPFHAASAMETLSKVLNQDPVPPRQLNPRIPRDLEAICVKCLEKRRQSRYRSCSELAEDLHQFLTGQMVRVRGGPLWERAPKWVRSHPVQAVALLLFAVLWTVLHIHPLSLTWNALRAGDVTVAGSFFPTGAAIVTGTNALALVLFAGAQRRLVLLSRTRKLKRHEQTAN